MFSILQGAAVVLVLSAVAVGDSIVLKATARLAPDATRVSLEDIAHLDGAEANALAATEIARIPADRSAKSPSLTVTIDDVRRALEAAGARLSLIDLSGHETLVQLPDAEPRLAQPLAMRGLAVDPDHAPVPVAAAQTVLPGFFADEALGTATPRGLIARMLSDVHRNKGTRIRLVIEGADASLLDARGPHRYEIVPLATLSTDRVPMRIIERDGDLVVARHEVTVLPRLEREVAIATRAIRRGEALDEAIEFQTVWVAPSEFARFVTRDRVAGATAGAAVALGEQLLASSVRQPVEIRRNDRVLVRREMGLLVIEVTAIALSEGAVGDEIELRMLDRKDRRAQNTFTAVVVGPGRAALKEGV